MGTILLAICWKEKLEMMLRDQNNVKANGVGSMRRAHRLNSRLKLYASREKSRLMLFLITTTGLCARKDRRNQCQSLLHKKGLIAKMILKKHIDFIVMMRETDGV